jgi:antitoxin HicB
MKTNVHRGSDFRDFLKEEGILEEIEERAMKKALAIQLEKLIAKNKITKAEMALRMKTSRAAVDRLLDASDPSLPISTLGKAARALGRKIRIELVPTWRGGPQTVLPL